MYLKCISVILLLVIVFDTVVTEKAFQLLCHCSIFAVLVILTLIRAVRRVPEK